MPKDKVNNEAEKELDTPDTLHEQLKKIKEESSSTQEDSTKSTQEQNDVDHPIHDYCS